MVLSNDEKINISKQIKNESIQTIEEEYDKLLKISKTENYYGSQMKLGNKIIDYFTFTKRLETKGKYNCSFFDFVENIEEFKKKQFIQNMLYFKTKTKKKNIYYIYKQIYDICITSVNIMRPIYCMELFTKYKPHTVLNFCSGWGGSLLACSVLNVPKYIGIEINTSLKEPYSNMISFLEKRKETEKIKKTEKRKENKTIIENDTIIENKTIIENTKFEMYFQDALLFDYESITYDCVFTSPPYYFLEKYENNNIYENKKIMDNNFYIPLFTKTYKGLSPGGYYMINICSEIYEKILIPLLGESHEKIPYNKYKRNNIYKEYTYIWKK